MELFLRDLEARFDDERRREMDALVDDLTDAERVGITLAGRLGKSLGRRISVVLRGGRIREGLVVDTASTWMLLREDSGDVLVLVAAIVAAWPMGVGGADEEVLHRRIGAGHVLRELAARGSGVIVDHDAGRHQGVIDGVYSDHLDLLATSDARRVDSRDRAEDIVLSLSLAGIRAIDVVGDRW